MRTNWAAIAQAARAADAAEAAAATGAGGAAAATTVPSSSSTSTASPSSTTPAVAAVAVAAARGPVPSVGTVATAAGASMSFRSWGGARSSAASDVGGPVAGSTASAAGPGSGGGSLVSGLVERAAGRLKAKGEKHKRGDYLLHMNPRGTLASGQAVGPVGIPVREILQQIYHHKRDKTVKDCWIYFLYTIVFVAVVYQINNSKDAYSTNAAVFSLFLDEEFVSRSAPMAASQPGYAPSWDGLGDGPRSTLVYGDDLLNDTFMATPQRQDSQLPLYTTASQFKKTFFDIGSFEEVRDWLTGPLYNNMYASTYYNGDPMPDSERGMLRHTLRIVGGVRLWQVRVTNASCSVLDSLGSAYERYMGGGASLSPADGSTCSAFFPGINEDTAPFGPGGRYKWTENGAASDANGLAGWGEATYGRSGYFVFLPNDPDVAGTILSDLMRDRWLGENMRALMVDFNLYNADTHLLTVSRFMVEFLPTGLFLTSYRLYTFKISLYATLADRMRAVGEVIVLLGCAFYLVQELLQLYRSRPRAKYFSDPANAFDLVLQACMLCCVIYWVYHILDVKSRTFNPDTVALPCADTAPSIPGAYGPPTCFEDLYGFAQNFNYAVTFAGFLGFLMSMKFFKYFSISRRMSTLWLTLARASQSLIAFTIGFTMMAAGFAFMGQMCFGSMVADFHTFESSFSALLRYPLGDFDYNALTRARPDMAAVFFVLYMALVFLVCMNMIVGIITVAFEEVNERLKVEEKWKHAGRNFEQHHLQKIRVRFRACARWLTLGKVGGDGADELMLASELHYLRLMGAFIERAEEVSRVDLLRYMEDVYKACPPGQNLYMGINELCSLARASATTQPMDPFCESSHRDAGIKARGVGGSMRSPGGGARQAGAAAGWRGVAARLCPCVPLGGEAAGGPGHAHRGANPLSSSSSGPGGAGGGGPGSVSVQVQNPLNAGSKGAGAASSAGSSGGSGASEERSLRRSNTLGSLRPGMTPAQVAAEKAAADAGALSPEDLEALHGHRCIAWRLVHAFYAYKDVTCLGKTERHQFWGDGIKALGANGGASSLSSSSNVKGSWEVTKLNRSHKPQRRIISVESDKDRYLITSRDPEHRLKRRFPISQVVQCEASLLHPTRAFLYIEASAREQREWDSYLAVTQDTVYDLQVRGGKGGEVLGPGTRSAYQGHDTTPHSHNTPNPFPLPSPPLPSLPHLTLRSSAPSRTGRASSTSSSASAQRCSRRRRASSRPPWAARRRPTRRVSSSGARPRASSAAGQARLPPPRGTRGRRSAAARSATRRRRSRGWVRTPPCRTLPACRRGGEASTATTPGRWWGPRTTCCCSRKSILRDSRARPSPSLPSSTQPVSPLSQTRGRGDPGRGTRRTGPRAPTTSTVGGTRRRGAPAEGVALASATAAPASATTTATASMTGPGTGGRSAPAPLAPGAAPRRWRRRRGGARPTSPTSSAPPRPRGPSRRPRG
jgi:hypothetical protein